MSQFDFPRIHFSGFTKINPGTGNNNYHFPLCFYDPIKSNSILPPRVYLLDKYLKSGMSWDDLMKKIPQDSPIITENEESKYIEILPISDKKSFLKWAVIPLGMSDLDEEYHDLYKLLIAPKMNASIVGEYPGYWNYYGDMTFSFDNVKIRSIQVEEGDAVKTITDEDNGATEEHLNLLGSEVTLTNKSGKSTSVMIDVLPTEAYYTQIFCDEIRIHRDAKDLLVGKPLKASVRFYNTSRIVNQNNILGASGTFYSVIPLENIQQHVTSPLYQFIERNCDSLRSLKGIIIRYDLSEIFENRNHNYENADKRMNPAESRIIGSISPWYINEMKSFTIGRQLIPINPFMGRKYMGSLICVVNFERKRISLDLISNIPRVNISLDKGIDTSLMPNQYETYELGKLDLELKNIDGTFLIGSFRIGPNDTSLEWLIKTGGILDFDLDTNLSESNVNNGYLQISGIHHSADKQIEEEKILLKESDYLIATDQAGIYAQEGQNPYEGFVSYGYPKEPCQIRIFSKGFPVTKPIDVYRLEYSISIEGTKFGPSKTKLKLKDMDVLEFPVDKSYSSIFYFTTELPLKAIANFVPEILKHGSIVNLRVLPSQDYEIYLNSEHPEYIDTIPFEVIYEEIFRIFDIVYPIAGKISPFDMVSIKRVIPMLRKLMSPANWDSNTYMPSTREMSEKQYLLFERWCEQQLNE